MVKFFDRRKVEREIDRLQKLRDGGEHSRELEGQVAKLRDDLMYVRHFPNDEPYVSVVQAKDEKALRKIEAIKGRIRRKLAERAALTSPSDQRTQSSGHQPGQSTPSPACCNPARWEGRVQIAGGTVSAGSFSAGLLSIR